MFITAVETFKQTCQEFYLHNFGLKMLVCLLYVRTPHKGSQYESKGSQTDYQWRKIIVK